MTPDERARYERHRAAMRPRSVTIREQERRDREAVEILKRPNPAPESAARAVLREAYERLQADLARINAELAAEATPQSEGDTQ